MDDNNTNYEQEIDLKELMFAILRKWRQILVIGAVMAAVAGGYKVVSARLNYDPSAAVDAENKYKKERELYDQKVTAKEREIEHITEDIAKQEEYLEKSVYINMSPYDIWEARTELFVKTDYKIIPDMTYQNKDFTATVLQSYQSALNNAKFMKEVAGGIGIDSRYLKELISVSIGRSDNGYNNLLIIQVRHENEESVKAVMERLLEEVKNSTGRIQSVIGAHTITEVSSSMGSVVDLELADVQRREADQLVRLKDSLAQRQVELVELQDEEVKEPEANSGAAVVKSGVKYGLLGGMLGAFGTMFFVCAAFVMSDKVSSGKELKYRFQLKVLGTLPLGRPKSRHPFDLWLDRMEGRSCGKDINQEYDLMAVNILNYMEGIPSLFVTGGASEEIINQVAEGLRRRMSGIQILSGGNFLSDPESLKKLAQCKAVVLVEQCKVSLYGNVELEKERITDLRKRIVGCVMVE